MKVDKKTWKQDTWPYDSNHAKKMSGKIWSVKCGRGIIYLQDDEHFSFTVDFGANSDFSYSGCFFGHDEIKTIEDAKKAINKKEFFV